tara:strand:- start:488 stop:1009 length:522 start_codon:yes stop_codon:yes gene_type:complete
MNSNNYEMATPINSLKNQNTNINNLVRNVENNIETLNNTSNVPMSAPQPIINQPPQYNPNIPIQDSQPQIQYNQVNTHQQLPLHSHNATIAEEKKPIKKNVVKKKESLSKYILANIKEYLIIVLLFSLLAHKKIHKLLTNRISFLSNYDSPIPSLLLRGVIFSVLLIVIKRCI